MSFRDSNGRITIDEVVASKDIEKLRISIDHMQSAINLLQEILIQVDGFSGNTGNCIREEASMLLSDIKKSISNTEETIGKIQETVEKYLRIDEEVKNIATNGVNLKE